MPSEDHTTSSTFTYWTPEETSLLIRLYPRASWADLCAALPGRTEQAISGKARALKVKRRIREQRAPTRHTPNPFELVTDERGQVIHAEIILTTAQGEERARVKVDVCDLDFVLGFGRWVLLTMAKGHHGGPYAYSSGSGTSHAEDRPAVTLMHRLVLERVRGDLPSSHPETGERLVCDHRDGDGLNNTRDNLALITQSQNLRKSRPDKRRAPAQMGLPEGVRREHRRIVAIASIDRRGVSITRIDPRDHESEDAAIALAACIRQAVQELIHGPDAIGVDAEHCWRDLVSEEEALVWAVAALETRARYKLAMRKRYEARLRELRGMMG